METVRNVCRKKFTMLVGVVAYENHAPLIAAYEYYNE